MIRRVGVAARRFPALVAILAATLAFAIAGAIVIARQLDAATKVQRELGTAQEQLFAAVRTQLVQQSALRGFLASGDVSELDAAQLGADDPFPTQIARMGRAVHAADVRELDPLLADLVALHERWRREVADPLVRDPHGPLAAQRMSLGKLDIDQMHVDVNRAEIMLDAHLDRAEAHVKLRVGEVSVVTVASILVFGALALIATHRQSRTHAALTREREIVETLQSVFRAGWDRLPNTRIGTAYRSASREIAIGGDLFDVRRLDEHRGLLVLADVSGKGLEAAVNTAFVKYTIRALALDDDDPGRIVGKFNRLFLQTIKDPAMFVVLFVGIIDTAGLTLRYASAGHGAAFLRRDGRVEQLAVTGSLIGLAADQEFATARVLLRRGDTLVLATDGLTEARDAAGEILDDVGAMQLVGAGADDPQRLADEVVEIVARRSGGRFVDDLALLAVRLDRRTDDARETAAA